MVFFLLSIVEKLYGQVIETPHDNGKRMLSVITIMCCISRIYSKDIIINRSFISMLLYMLCLWPEQDYKRCSDWEYLDKNVPPKFKKESYASVQMFITALSQSELLFKPEWLYAIPVMHFFKGSSEPFQEFQFDPKKVLFGDTHIDLRAVKAKIYNRDIFW